MTEAESARNPTHQPTALGGYATPILTGLLIAAVGIVPVTVLGPLNARLRPDLPWAAAVTLAYLGLLLLWLNGSGPPTRARLERRQRLRLWPRSKGDGADASGLTAGAIVAFLGLLYVLWIMVARLSPIPRLHVTRSGAADARECSSEVIARWITKPRVCRHAHHSRHKETAACSTKYTEVHMGKVPDGMNRNAWENCPCSLREHTIEHRSSEQPRHQEQDGALDRVPNVAAPSVSSRIDHDLRVHDRSNGGATFPDSGRADDGERAGRSEPPHGRQDHDGPEGEARLAAWPLVEFHLP